MDKKSFAGGIAATLVVAGGAVWGVTAWADEPDAAPVEVVEVAETVTVQEPKASNEVVKPTVEAEVVPAPEPEPVVVEDEAAPAPVQQPAPAPQPLPEGVTIVEPETPAQTWTGEDGRTYAPNPLTSDPAAPPVIVEPTPTPPEMPPAVEIPPQG